MIIYCDIDNTIANLQHRLHFLDDKNYDKFYAAENIEEDGDMEFGRYLLESLSRGNWDDVYFVTGRPERTRPATRRWLIRHGYPDRHLLMRQDNDWRPAAQVKVDLIKMTDVGEKGIFVDDDPRNVRAIEEAFDHIHGLISGTGRLTELTKEV